MKIREVNEDKKQFISLLLLGDEQESMVDRYLEKGTMYVLEDNDVKAECVVTDEGNEILEIKNIAGDPENQGKGYGTAALRAAVAWLKEQNRFDRVRINYVEGNGAAQAVYRKVGFR